MPSVFTFLGSVHSALGTAPLQQAHCWTGACIYVPACTHHGVLIAGANQ
jgi:hypothetical protein